MYFRSRLSLALVAWLLAGCAQPVVAPPAAASAAPPPVHLRVIAFNDFHGNLEPGNLSLTLADPARPGSTLRVPVGSAAALAGLVQALRAGAPHSALVASGDSIGAAPLVSSLFRHESTIEVLNAIGVDAITVGNHEFDAGQLELQRLLGGGCAANDGDATRQSCALHPYRGARFAVVTANVEMAGGQPLFAPSWVREFGGVKVGFIGAVTRATPSIVVPSGVAGLRFTDEAQAINRAAAALKAQGVRAMVAMIHEGGEIGSSGQLADWNDTDCPFFRGYIVAIARTLTPDVGVLFSGHTHQGYRCIVDGRPVLQATSYGRGVSVADLWIDSRTGEIDRARTESRNLPVLNASTPAAMREALAAAQPEPYAQALRSATPVAAVQAQVAVYANLASARAGREVGRIAGNFERGGRTDSAAGRLIADAQLAATRDAARGGAQLALMNPGGIRTDLACSAAPPCVVTYGAAFAMQPFGNSLVVMSLRGAELKALLEFQQPAGRAAPLLLSPSAGLSYRWLARAPAGQRVAQLRLNGALIESATDYRVTVNSFMAEGGDGLSLLRQGRNRVGGVQDLDALIALLQTAPAPTAAPRIEWVE